MSSPIVTPLTAEGYGRSLHEHRDPTTPAPDEVRVDWSDCEAIAAYRHGEESFLMPFWSGGPVLTHDEFEEFVALARRFYEIHSPEWVHSFNLEAVAAPAFEEVSSWARGTAGRRPATGYVYVLRGGPFFKIGAARDSDKRLKQLKIQLPFSVELEHRVETDDVYACERYFHETFARKRLNGEWFGLTDLDVLWIKQSPAITFHDW